MDVTGCLSQIQRITDTCMKWNEVQKAADRSENKVDFGLWVGAENKSFAKSVADF